MVKSILVVFVSVLVIVSVGFFALHFSNIEEPPFSEFNSTFVILAHGLTHFGNDSIENGLMLKIGNTLDEDIFILSCRAYVDGSPLCGANMDIQPVMQERAGYPNAKRCKPVRWQSGEYKLLRLGGCDLIEHGLEPGEKHEVQIKIDYFKVEELIDYFKVEELGEDLVDMWTRLQQLWDDYEDDERAYDYLVSEGVVDIDYALLHVDEETGEIDTGINETIYTSKGKIVDNVYSIP